MVNLITVFVINLLLFVIVDWKSLKKNNGVSRWTYIFFMVIGFSIFVYMHQSLEPFRPSSWLYYRIQPLLHH